MVCSRNAQSRQSCMITLLSCLVLLINDYAYLLGYELPEHYN